MSEMHELYAIYAQMNEFTVLDLLRRGGSVRNKEFSLVSFVPPQLFRRYTAAQDLCKKLRVENEGKFYTVRIGMSDVVVLWKNREDKYWERIDEETMEELPEWEDNKKWMGMKSEMELPNYDEYSPLKNGRISEGTKRKEISPAKMEEQPLQKALREVK